MAREGVDIAAEMLLPRGLKMAVHTNFTASGNATLFPRPRS
jgi:hypothetical protein